MCVFKPYLAQKVFPWLSYPQGREAIKNILFTEGKKTLGVGPFFIGNRKQGYYFVWPYGFPGILSNTVTPGDLKIRSRPPNVDNHGPNTFSGIVSTKSHRLC